MLVRALNFNVGLQKYTVIFITALEVVSDVCSGLKEEENDVQIGVCGFTKTVKGMTCVCMSRTQTL